MSLTRRAVLEQLAATSDAARGETTTVEALASALDAGESAVDAHLEGLTACELARKDDGEVRVTLTGEEFLALALDDVVIVEPPSSGGDA